MLSVSLDFLSNGIEVAAWIKMPITYPGDSVVDEYLKKLKKTGRSKSRIEYMNQFLSTQTGISELNKRISSYWAENIIEYLDY